MFRAFLRFSKLMLANLLYYSGVLRLLMYFRLRGKIPILMYHRVIDDAHRQATDSHPGIIVSADAFTKQMQAVRRFFNPISLSQFEGHVLHGKPIPPRSCLVTFDDGWLDNYEIALPILRKYAIPAAIFVPVGLISGDNMFWQEEMLMRLTGLLTSGSARDSAKLRRFLHEDDLSMTIEVEQIRDHVVNLKSSDDEQIEATLIQLRRVTEDKSYPDHYNRYMSWSQLTALQATGIAIASHAMSHRRLSRLSVEDCGTELRNSRRELEKHLNTSVTTIAYPNGDFNDVVLELTREAGYRLGFATWGGMYDRTCNQLTIPRINLHDNNSASVAQFLCTCTGIL